VAGRYGGVYASHMRDEGPAIKDAIEEALAVGREGHMPVQISHFKIDTKSIWGSSSKTLAQVEQARRDGLEVTVDQYPYRASSTGLRANLLPSWVQSDGWDKMKERLTDPATRKKIVQEMSALLKKKGRKNLDYAVVARCRFDQSLEGKNISQINREKGRKTKLEQELETVMDLELQGNGQGIQMVYFSMSDDDVERIMRAPFTAVASDAGVIKFGTGMPHPRGYGSNSRSLAVYVREKKVLTLEDAIRRMTSLPAQTFRLHNRGWLREGYAADVVVFDPEKVADMATFEKPHQYAVGFVAVLVNGEPVVLEGQHTGARPGKVLLGPGTKSNQIGSVAGGGN
jgi:N-acyl-D-amino-acid deacylase